MPPRFYQTLSGLMILWVALGCLVTSCHLTPAQRFDLAVTEAGNLAQDFHELAQEAASPDTAAALEDASQALRQAQSMAGAEAPASTLDALERALDAAEAALDAAEEPQGSDARLALFGARAFLRRLRSYGALE